jgi:hypothetical protein
MPITARVAMLSAIRSLEQRGVRDVRLCSIDWMVAGVGAALIYATGRWDLEGVHFETFFVSIHDGTEAKYGHLGGDEHFMLARGFDRAGHETYYYTGGTTPRTLRYADFDTDDDLMFESLASRETLQNLRQTCGLRSAP